MNKTITDRRKLIAPFIVLNAADLNKLEKKFLKKGGGRGATQTFQLHSPPPLFVGYLIFKFLDS